VQKDEKNFCYIVHDTQTEAREVLLGDTNDRLIEIKDGVVDGDRVVLNPRSVVPEARDHSGQPETKKNGMGIGVHSNHKAKEPPSAGDTSATDSKSSKGKSKKKQAVGPLPQD
jgi:HlyD family secretion protein